MTGRPLVRRQPSVGQLYEHMPAHRERDGDHDRADGDAAAESGHSLLLILFAQLGSAAMSVLLQVNVTGSYDGRYAEAELPRDFADCAHCRLLGPDETPHNIVAVSPPGLCPQVAWFNLGLLAQTPRGWQASGGYVRLTASGHVWKLVDRFIEHGGTPVYQLGVWAD